MSSAAHRVRPAWIQRPTGPNRMIDSPLVSQRRAARSRIAAVGSLGLAVKSKPSRVAWVVSNRARDSRRVRAALWRRARADGSYASANDPRVLVGLGNSAERPNVRARWPGGRVEEWDDATIDRWTTLKEGGGTRASWPAKRQMTH